MLNAASDDNGVMSFFILLRKSRILKLPLVTRIENTVDWYLAPVLLYICASPSPLANSLSPYCRCPDDTIDDNLLLVALELTFWIRIWVMSTRSLTFLLILTIISTSSSFHISSSKTNVRTITRSTSMSLKTMGFLRKAFATAALTVIFTGDLGDSNQLISFTPPAAHARGMNESRWQEPKCFYFLHDAAWDDSYAFTADYDVSFLNYEQVLCLFLCQKCNFFYIFTPRVPDHVTMS